MNVYGLYKRSRDASWQTLLDHNIRELPVSVIRICNQSGISVVKNSTVNELRNREDAISILDGKKWYIIYDDTVIQQRSRFTLAHELGHIFLGHPLKAGYHARTIDTERPEVERQADRFAADLLAPACVLWGLGVRTAEEIQTLCNISRTAAEIRMKRMDVLYQRNAFLLSPLEQAVYRNFQDYIRCHKK